ncbi:hypothetical protein [Pseudogemmobacter sonorensis]|uniref:hypothetical protein n=1 Tax=Pseudogemmobacter sonorensis TaxID=2989681 RepID=UPI003680600C
MHKSNRYCAAIPAGSVGNVSKNIEPNFCSAREEKAMEIESSGGGAMLPYVRLHKLIQE